MRTYNNIHKPLVLDHHGKQYVLRIQDLPLSEKPREKLVKFGPGILSMPELVAIILSVGTKKEGVLAMSNRLLREYGEKAIADQKSPRILEESLQIPLTKACQLVAALELGRRLYEPSRGKLEYLRSAEQVFEYLTDMRDLPKEHLRGLYLNTHYRVVHDEVISIGSLTANIIHPREVFKPAIDRGASAVIIAHNHPSGVVEASEADIEITKQLIEAGKILGISLLDHVIITSKAYKSIDVAYQ